jgi:decaprenylphospho-beta-D-erythro-pentofuranosid-2-ulose 2-reductase
MVVRPGFVRTRMTEGMSEAPFATDADAVAQDVVTGLRKGRSVVYAPAVLRAVMSGLKALPAPVFRRLPG